MSMCFTRPSTRRLPIAIPAVASIHTRALNFHPQSTRILWRPSICRCRTHQPIILRFARADCNRGLSFAVRADGYYCHPASTHNQKHSSLVRIQPAWSVSHQDSIRPLEQPNQPRTHSEKTSLYLQSHFIPVRRLLHLACQIPTLDLYTRSVTGEIL